MYFFTRAPCHTIKVENGYACIIDKSDIELNYGWLYEIKIIVKPPIFYTTD